MSGWHVCAWIITAYCISFSLLNVIMAPLRLCSLSEGLLSSITDPNQSIGMTFYCVFLDALDSFLIMWKACRSPVLIVLLLVLTRRVHATWCVDRLQSSGHVLREKARRPATAPYAALLVVLCSSTSNPCVTTLVDIIHKQTKRVPRSSCAISGLV
jgi:hypothetical protein